MYVIMGYISVETVSCTKFNYCLHELLTCVNYYFITVYFFSAHRHHRVDKYFNCVYVVS